MQNNKNNQEPFPYVCPRGNSRSSADPHLTRRGFFHVCLAAMTGIGAFIVAFPVLSFFKLPRRINITKVIEVLLGDLSEDQALFFDREGVKIIVIYTNKQPKVFDAACTHLGCLVSWDQNEHVFHCPCHGAIFDDQGRAVKGPTNTPLKKIEFALKNDKLIIS